MSRWGSADRFFFSSRRRHTRFDCDWSDVCSSDLAGVEGELVLVAEPPGNSGNEPPCDLITNVQQHDPRPTEQPLEPARGEKIHSRGLHVYEIGRASCRERV